MKSKGGIVLLQLLSKQRFFVTLCVIGAFAILSCTMSKNPVLNPFAESLGTPIAFMGFVAAVSTLPGVVISFPVGSISDVLGRRKVLLVSCVVYASAPFFYVLVSTWWHLILVRFFHGFATATFIPVARATVADYYPTQKGERISTFTSATFVGKGIAPFLGGFILSVTLWNFQLLYVAVGMAGLTALFVTLFFLRTRNEVMTTPSYPNIADQPPTPVSEITSGGWRKIMQHRGILMASTIEAVARYVYGAMEFFFIGYLKNVAQLDPSLIGVIMGVQFLLIPIVGPLMGRVSDRVGRTIPILLGLLLGMSIIVVPFVTAFLPLFVISFTFGLGFATVISSTPALVTDLVKRETYGAAMGFLATFMGVGQMLGPIITGIILASFGYPGSFLSLGIILVGGILLFGGYRYVVQHKPVRE